MTINESVKEIEKMNLALTVRGNRKKIRCMETGIVWESLADVAREFNLPYISFATCIRKYGKYGPYHFEYIG